MCLIFACTDCKSALSGVQLWNYNGGEVAGIFKTGNLTENQRSTMLESVESRFKRDVILNDKILGTTTLVNNTVKLVNKLGNSIADESLRSTLNGLINSWNKSINTAKKEQTDITNQYGK